MRRCLVAGVVTLLAMAALCAGSPPPALSDYQPEMVKKINEYLAQAATTDTASVSSAHQVSDTDAQRDLGTYLAPDGLVPVDRLGGYLRLPWHHRWLRLLALGGGRFSAVVLVRGNITCPDRALTGLQFTFATIEQRELLIVHRGATLHWAAEKLAPQPIAACWHSRLGAYGTEAQTGPPGRLTVERGFLVWRRPNPAGAVVYFPLQIDSATTARLAGLAAGAGAVLTVEPSGGQERLRIAGVAWHRLTNTAKYTALIYP